VTLIGNVGADPEVRATPGGGRVANFSLATSRTWNDHEGTKQEKTEWHRCVVWNTKASQLADIVEQYVKKGDRLYLVGRLEYRKWTDAEGHERYSTEINVREVIMLGGGRNGGRDAAGDAAGEEADEAGSGPARRSAAPRATRDAGPAGAVGAGAEPRCPKCAGPMWDNREGKRNPKAPDFKCKNRNCDGVVWPPRDGVASAEPVRHAVASGSGGSADFEDFPGALADEHDDLPF